ncbi:MAG: hypothetical protein ACJAWV_003027 [Flammeovirgaceae bacterium]|jgi:hypothetical protein
MKNIYFSLFVLLFSVGLNAQNTDGQPIEPTEKLTKGLGLKFKAEKLLFGWRKVGDLYIAVFQHGTAYQYGAFDVNGRWQEAGTQVQVEEIPETVTNALPEMDITAFLVEAFQANTNKDKKGYFFLYETELNRLEFLVDNSGKILRQAQYPIPEKKEEKEEEEKKEEWR